VPRLNIPNFRCFWSTGSGWGVFSVASSGMRLQVLKGKLACRSTGFRGVGGKATVMLAGKVVAHKLAARSGVVRVEFDQALTIEEGKELRVDIRA